MLKLIFALLSCIIIADGASNNFTVGQPMARQQDTGRLLTDATVTNPNIAVVYDKNGDFFATCFIINRFWVMCHQYVNLNLLTKDGSSFVVPNPGLEIPTSIALQDAGEHKIKNFTVVSECTDLFNQMTVLLLEICPPFKNNPTSVLPTVEWSDFWSTTGTVKTYYYQQISPTTKKLTYNTNTLIPSTTGNCADEAPAICATFSVAASVESITSNDYNQLAFYIPSSGSTPIIAGFETNYKGDPQSIIFAEVKSCANIIRDKAREYP